MSRLSAFRLSISTSEESASGDLHRSSGGTGSVAGGDDLEGVEAVSGVSEEVGGSVAGISEAAVVTGGPCTDSGTLANGISSLFCTLLEAGD